MVTHNPDRHRFESTQDGKTARLTYKVQPGKIVFEHALVPRELEGQGLAGQLAVAGLEYAREQGLKVVPMCPYVATYIKRHPEYRELVDEHHLDRVQ